MNMLKEIWYLQSIEASWSHPFAVQGSQTAQVPNAPQWIGVLLWCYSRCGFCMSQNIHDPVDGDRMWQIVCQFVISLSIVQLYLICFFLKTYQMKACAKRTRYWQCEAPGASFEFACKITPKQCGIVYNLSNRHSVLSAHETVLLAGFLHCHLSNASRRQEHAMASKFVKQVDGMCLISF